MFHSSVNSESSRTDRFKNISPKNTLKNAMIEILSNDCVRTINESQILRPHWRKPGKSPQSGPPKHLALKDGNAKGILHKQMAASANTKVTLNGSTAEGE